MLTLLTNMPRDVLIRQLQDGLVLLVLGMGFVFIFLAVLIFVTKLMSRICNRISPAKAAPQPRKMDAASTTPITQAPAANAGARDAEIAVAIAAAYSKSHE